MRLTSCIPSLLGVWLLVPCAAWGQRSASADDTARFHRLLDDDWNYLMKEFPELATQVGYPGQNHRWTDISPEAIERRKLRPRQSLQVLQSVDRSRLSPADRLNYDFYLQAVEDAIEGQRFGLDLASLVNAYEPSVWMPLHQMDGIQLFVPRMIAQMPTFTVKGYEDIVARLNAVPALADQTIALMKVGLAKGLTPPRVALREVPDQIQKQIVADPIASPMLRAFSDFPESIPPAERERLTREAAAAYSDKVVPAWRKLHAFLVNAYIPAAREKIAFTSLPDGPAWYAYYVRRHTTTRLTPQQIHEIGLAEVRRIRAEMEKTIAATGFRGSFDEFSQFLRSDPRFFFTDPASLVSAYRDIAKRADPELVKLFGKLPRLPYGVVPVPDYAAPSQTTAYYEQGSPAAGRPGHYFVNAYNLKARPKWEMEALTLHESVPGHHLQIALAQELEGVPEFRKYAGTTAFVEGWALYAEGLGDEMGFYTDPYSRYGQLSYQMWRAVRLVVDTGMHALGWSRQQAIDLFKSNSGKSEHDITVEIDRYLVWPGQALAYKTGELKIRELRAYAAKELGDAFNLRAFHDELLSQGALPLDLLEARIREWVAAQQKAALGKRK